MPDSSDGLVDWDDVGKPSQKGKRSKNRAGPKPPMQAEVLVPALPPIPIPEDVPPFEAAYRLPMLLGTPRQVGWARAIRMQFLSALLPQLMVITQSLTKDDAKMIYEAMDHLRSERQAKTWIEVMRKSLGDEVSYLLALPKVIEMESNRRREAEAAKAEAKLRAAEGRKIAKEADAFAKKHGLPAIDSPYYSTRQASFGRRCRHELLSTLSEAELAAVLPVVRDVNDAGVWIGAKDGPDPLDYVRQQAAKMALRHDRPDSP